MKAAYIFMFIIFVTRELEFAIARCSTQCSAQNSACNGRCITFSERDYNTKYQEGIALEMCWQIPSCANFPKIYKFVWVDREVCNSQCAI